MSLSSSRRHIAVLGSRGVGLLRRAKSGAGPWHLESRPAGEGDGSATSWAAAMEALASLCKDAGVRRGELSVVLATHFVRFLLLAWNDDIKSPKELEAYARAVFDEVYGAGTRWSVSVSPEAAEQPRLAAAVSEDLLEGLHGSAASGGFRIRSIRPYLTAAFNHLRQRMNHNDFVLAVAEPDRGSLLMRRRGRWAAIRSNAAMDSDEGIAALVARECELQGLDEAEMIPVFLHAPDRMPAVTEAINGVMPRALAIPGPQASGSNDVLWNMALAAT